MNGLILGDCLEVLKKIEDESVDLIYLDPPFFSNRNYEVIWGDKGEIRSFEDRWSGGVEHYIAWLKERVQEMHRILKPSGSIYLHCDDNANAYIRVYILDKIFGDKMFLNELIWKRTSSHNKVKRFGQIHDTIYLYTKTKNYCFNSNEIKVDYEENYLNKVFTQTDNYGNFKRADLTGDGIRYGDSGLKWRDYDITSKNRHWAIPEALKKQFNIDCNLSVIETLEELDKKNLILHAKSTKALPGYKNYSFLSKGKHPQSVIEDINPAQSKERIGYPTQKPEKLLERIILASSNEGDTVLDPFVGGGTTVAVADRLKRKWIGIDQSVAAIKVSEMRLNNQQNLFSEPFTVTLHKYDYDTLRYKDAFEFEKWIVERFGGLSNAKQRNDFGMDGRTRENVPIQVKRSDNIGRNVVDNFKSACERYDKTLFDKNRTSGQPIGYIIAFSFGRGAVQEVARLKNEEGTLINLLTVEDIVPIAKKPKLSVTFADKGTDSKGQREIEFRAVAESESGIEMYSWDFDFIENEPFKAEVLIDRTGEQIYKFKPGMHTIAVKAVDTEGMEAIEIIKLKVNGVAEQVQ